MKFGNNLNVVVCLLVVLSGVFFILKLRKPKDKSQDFIYISYWCWFFSWLFWLFLWLFGDKIDSRISLILSDFNTLSQILFYYSFTRGKTSKDNFVENVFKGLFILAGFIVLLYVVPFISVKNNTSKEILDLGFKLHLNLSITLSMISSVLIGWAFRLRHQTNWVLLIGAIYAATQPIAYLLKFENESENNYIYFSQPTQEMMFVVLAILKVVWAISVTYFVGRKPLTSESLIKDIEADADHTFKKDHILSYFDFWRTIRDKNSKNPFEYILKCFSKTWQNKIKKGGELEPDEEQDFELETLRVLNEILKDKSFYNKQLFEGISFSKRTKKLLKKYNHIRSEKVFETINRSLLEDLFNKQIVTSFWLNKDWRKTISYLLFAIGGVAIIFSIMTISSIKEIPYPIMVTILAGIISITKPILDLVVWGIGYLNKK